MSYLEKKLVRPLGDIFKGVWDSAVSLTKFMYTLDLDHLTASIQSLFRDVLGPVFKPVFALLGIEGETVYATEVVTVPLYKEEGKYLKSTLNKALIHDLDIAEEIRYAIQTNQLITARAYLSYARNKSFFGLPEAVAIVDGPDTITATSVISSIEGEAITITYIRVGEPDTTLWVKEYLMNNNSYSLETNILITGGENWEFDYVSGGPSTYTVNIKRDVSTQVIVEDYTQVLLDPTEFTDTWTRTTTIIDDGTTIDSSYVDTNYVRTPTTTGGPYETTIVPVSDDTTVVTEYDTLPSQVNAPNAGAYYEATYYLDSDPSTKEIWFYEIATEVFPEITIPVIDGDKDNLQIIPTLSIREEFINIGDKVGTPEYTSAKRILNLLNTVSLEDLTKELNANDDIDSVQDAFVTFGANIYSESQQVLLYLFNFFSLLEKASPMSKVEFLTTLPAYQSLNVFNFVVTQGRYNSAISFNYIDETFVVGSIGKKGYTETEFVILPNTVAPASVENEQEPENHNPLISKGLINSKLIIRTQINSREYVELEISGLVLTTYILTKGVKVDIKTIELVDPDTGSDEDKANFIVPISLSVLRQLSPFETDDVLSNSVQLVIYAEQSVYLEYYKTPTFLSLVQLIITILTIVIIVLTAGTGTGAAVSTQAALLSLLSTILIQVGLSLALREILKHNLSDTERAIVLAIYTAAQIYFSGGTNSGLALTFSDTALLAVTALSNAFQIDSESKLSQLREEEARLEDLIEERKDELEELDEYLTNDSTIYMDAILTGRHIANIDTTLTPTEFIERSLFINHAPIIYDRASTYVTSALDLNNIRSNFDTNTNDNTINFT